MTDPKALIERLNMLRLRIRSADVSKGFDDAIALLTSQAAEIERLTPKCGPAFRSGTGSLGATEPGQRVTPENIEQLPPGSVVRNSDGSRLIHLHDGVWLWCNECAWTYDRAANLLHRLDSKSVACHIPYGEV